MEKIHSSDYSSLYFNHDNKQMKVVWSAKQVSNEIFKAQIQLFSDHASRYRPIALFVDATDHKYTVPPEIQKWHDETIIPSYLKSGIKKMAFLTPESIFSELTTKKIFTQENAKQALPTAFFKTEKDALQWLSEH